METHREGTARTITCRSLAHVTSSLCGSPLLSLEGGVKVECTCSGSLPGGWITLSPDVWSILGAESVRERERIGRRSRHLGGDLLHQIGDWSQFQPGFTWSSASSAGVLPSCLRDVIWSQSLCNSDQGLEPWYRPITVCMPVQSDEWWLQCLSRQRGTEMTIHATQDTAAPCHPPDALPLSFHPRCSITRKACFCACMFILAL
nr:PREDICTED: uncharacterized protein LOC109641358 [Paralichthys olivaceus]XP_019961365.1 PREDICTED: uncharacterized protein LOC109641358 [Paralichthys olivaceus]